MAAPIGAMGVNNSTNAISELVAAGSKLMSNLKPGDQASRSAAAFDVSASGIGIKDENKNHVDKKKFKSFLKDITK